MNTDVEMTNSKVCRRCDAPIDAPRRKISCSAECAIALRRAQERIRYHANQKKILDLRKFAYWSDPEKAREQRRLRYWSNPEKAREDARRSYRRVQRQTHIAKTMRAMFNLKKEGLVP